MKTMSEFEYAKTIKFVNEARAVLERIESALVKADKSTKLKKAA